MRQRCVFRSRRRIGRSPWPRGLRRGSAAARLLGLWIRILPGTWMSVFCENCVLVGPISLPEETYRVWWVWVWSWSLGNENAMGHLRLLGLGEGEEFTLPAYEHCGLAVAHASSGTSAAWWFIVMCLQIKMYAMRYGYLMFAVGC